SGFLGEVSAHGPVDEVRVAALMASTVEAGRPIYTGWVIVSGRVADGEWAEGRRSAGRQRGEITEHGYGVPDRLTAQTEEVLAGVRGGMEAAGLAMRDGVRVADDEILEGVLG